MRRVRDARNERDRDIRIAWRKGRPCSYPLRENISLVKKLEIVNEQLKNLNELGIHVGALREGVNCNGDMLVEFQVAVAFAYISLRSG
jgi:hypothetical protein